MRVSSSCMSGPLMSWKTCGSVVSFVRSQSLAISRGGLPKIAREAVEIGLERAVVFAPLRHLREAACLAGSSSTVSGASSTLRHRIEQLLGGQPAHDAVRDDWSRPRRSSRSAPTRAGRCATP